MKEDIFKKARKFGGKWTEEKLSKVKKYLHAYATIMNKQKFRFAYIDAFAGTGYRTFREGRNKSEYLFPELVEKETQNFLAGSAFIALEIKPRFTKYIFIENEKEGFIALQGLKKEFPEFANDIEVLNADANAWLKDRCINYSWQNNRAVLFPLGVAVNRLLRRDGQINIAVKEKLDRFFGSTDWLDVFYEQEDSESLFGKQRKVLKVVDFKGISSYFVTKLKKIFAGVAENPLPLYNSKNNPLYLLCFASGNKKGAKTAIKIAQDILKG
ncbi:MAG: three-Cys-motif partner protein TcmP [Bacteroidota bacterium]|nr:three-Cys-motif partner protein TcmP [Bacteroidota bacterium]